MIPAWQSIETLMLCGVLRMPLDNQLGDGIALFQLQSRMIETADELENEQ